MHRQVGTDPPNNRQAPLYHKPRIETGDTWNKYLQRSDPKNRKTLQESVPSYHHQLTTDDKINETPPDEGIQSKLWTVVVQPQQSFVLWRRSHIIRFEQHLFNQKRWLIKFGCRVYEPCSWPRLTSLPAKVNTLANKSRNIFTEMHFGDIFRLELNSDRGSRIRSPLLFYYTRQQQNLLLTSINAVAAAVVLISQNSLGSTSQERWLSLHYSNCVNCLFFLGRIRVHEDLLVLAPFNVRNNSQVTYTYPFE